MIRFVGRLVALALLAGAFAAAVIDGARSIAASHVLLTPLGTTLYWAFPGKMPLLQAFIVRQIHPWLWDPILSWLLLAPTFLALGVLGGALLYALRRRPPSIGHSNRP